MSAAQERPWLSPEDYLESERQGTIRHEYVDGRVYAMAGASTPHGTIALNLAALLRPALRGTPCRGFVSDMKVRIETVNRYYYPDLVVTCDERDRANNDFKSHPCLIVEVLSPTTEEIDRAEKFHAYRTLESLREYVLISQDRMQVECFRRRDQSVWEYRTYTQAEEVDLESVGLHFRVLDIYEDVELPPESGGSDARRVAQGV